MTTLLLWIYQAGLILFGNAYLLIRLLRGRGLPGWRERMALYTADERMRLGRLRGPIWIHLVSVGEALAAQPLVEEIRRRFPERNWLITTVTDTGRTVARRLVREGRDEILYLPWDFAPVVRRAIRAIRPTLFLCFETELWPVLFGELQRHGAPAAVVNGRISPKAYRRYLWIRPFMERALKPVSLFLVQTPQDARRFAAIGAAKDRLVVTGSLKWDLRPPDDSNGREPERMKELLGLSPRAVLWTAGSIHPGEEGPILESYRRLKKEFPEMRLLLAPRHPERVPQMEEKIQAAGFKPVRRTTLGQGVSTGDAEIVVLDTLGELAAFYRVSHVVFVGGSLVPHGGHNLVEAAAMSRPILAGPYLHNFSAMAEELSQAGGMSIVRSASELTERVRRLVADPRLAKEVGERARAVVERNQGVTRRVADHLALRWAGSLPG